MEALSKNERKVITAFITRNTSDMSLDEICEATKMETQRAKGILSKMVSEKYLQSRKDNSTMSYHLTDNGCMIAQLGEEEIV